MLEAVAAPVPVPVSAAAAPCAPVAPVASALTAATPMETSSTAAVTEEAAPATLVDAAPEPADEPMGDAQGDVGVHSVHDSGAYAFVLDSGADRHMTAHLDVLYDRQPIPTGTVRVAHGVVLPCDGAGSLLFTASIDGPQQLRRLDGVWHVPGLTCNLVFSMCLQRAGFCIISVWP